MSPLDVQLRGRRRPGHRQCAWPLPPTPFGSSESLPVACREPRKWWRRRRGPTEVGWVGLLQPPSLTWSSSSRRRTRCARRSGKTRTRRCSTWRLRSKTVLSSRWRFLSSFLFSAEHVVADLDVGILIIMAFGSILVLPVWMAGWASNNKFALLGAMRAASQSISYEVPLLLSAPRSCDLGWKLQLRRDRRGSARDTVGSPSGLRALDSSRSFSSTCALWQRRTAFLSIFLKPSRSWSQGGHHRVLGNEVRPLLLGRVLAHPHRLRCCSCTVLGGLGRSGSRRCPLDGHQDALCLLHHFLGSLGPAPVPTGPTSGHLLEDLSAPVSRPCRQFRTLEGLRMSLFPTIDALTVTFRNLFRKPVTEPLPWKVERQRTERYRSTSRSCTTNTGKRPALAARCARRSVLGRDQRCRGRPERESGYRKEARLLRRLHPRPERLHCLRVVCSGVPYRRHYYGVCSRRAWLWTGGPRSHHGQALQQ